MPPVPQRPAGSWGGRRGICLSAGSARFQRAGFGILPNQIRLPLIRGKRNINLKGKMELSKIGAIY